MKKVNKKIAFIIIAVILVIALAVFIILGIVNKNKEEGKKETTSESKVFQDYNVGDGLLSVDDKNSNLSERQKIVLQYFDDNYLSIEDYSYFKRYPDIFKQTKVSFEAAVEKVLKSNDKEFEVLAQVMSGASASQSYVIIKGDQTERRLMEGECIKVQGRFINNEDMTIDGVSYNLPVIEYHNNIFCNVYDENGQLMPDECGCTDTVMYDEEFAKEVAKAIFGDNVSVRMGTEDDLVLGVHSWSDVFVIATLENQSNANFTSFEIYTNVPYIRDVKSTEKVIRYFNYTSDFNHYLISVQDTDFKTFTFEYYDKDLNKIWSREFEGTEKAIYDNTDNYIYAVVNNELHILDMKTGKDVVDPIAAANKVIINKLKDGVFLGGKDSFDTFMLVGLDGQVKWKTNYGKSIYGIGSIQLIDDELVVEVYQEDPDEPQQYFKEYVRLSAKDGSIISQTELY